MRDRELTHYVFLQQSSMGLLPAVNKMAQKYGNGIWGQLKNWHVSKKAAANIT